MKRLQQAAMLAFMISGVAGCGMFTHYEQEDCATLTGKDAMRCVSYRQQKAHAEMSHEVSELLKAYRQCIDKTGSDPEKAKINCAAYRDVLQSIQVSSMTCS
jgi:hypothetical protein